jgi:hypothetical protein
LTRAGLSLSQYWRRFPEKELHAMKTPPLLLFTSLSLRASEFSTSCKSEPDKPEPMPSSDIAVAN